MKHLYRSFLAGLLLLTPTLSNAAALAYYGFEENLSNSLPGFSLTAFNYDGSGAYTPPTADYATEMVFGIEKTVLNLTDLQGLNLDVSALANKTDYTIVMDVRSSQVSDYNKLMSLDGGSSDSGVYFYDGKATFYPLGSGGPTIAPNEWVRIALSYDGTTMNLYSGDPDSFALASTGPADSYYTLANTLQFLVDDTHTGRSENDALQISGLWLYDTPLTLENVGDLPAPEPTTASMLALVALFGLAKRRWR